MNVFLYPKLRHTRKYTPPAFKNYRTYKRYLRADFDRVCVYCRQPDTSAPNLNFSVDHYRPKGIARFSNLVTKYDNLYYCCGSCNSRKNDYWPADEKKGPYIVNPCDHEMASHLRFNAQSGEIEARTADGVYTEDLLQLNDEAQVKYRLRTLRIVGLLQKEIAEIQNQIAEARTLHQKNKMSTADLNDFLAGAEKDLADVREDLDMQMGTSPLPPGRLRGIP